jgi:hypothetical protein
MRHLFEEFLHKEGEGQFRISFDDIKCETIYLYDKGFTPEQIVIFLQEYLYVCRDEEEYQKILYAVNNILEGRPVINSVTKEVFL